MKALLNTILVSSLLVACGGNAPDAKDPSKTDTTSAPDTKAGDPTAKPTDAKPTDTTAAPTDAKPADTKTDATATPPATPATDDASKCKDAPAVKAKTKKACMTECSKLEAKSPEGSKCVPPKTQCEEQCKTLK